jgi:hypothetical protein
MRDKWPVSDRRLPLAKGMVLPVYVNVQSEPQNVTATGNPVTIDQEIQ